MAARSPFDPSRFVFEEAPNRPSTPPNNNKNVRFVSHQASFSEHVDPSVPPVSRRVIKPVSWPIPRSVVRPHTVLAIIFAIVIAVAYYPFPAPYPGQSLSTNGFSRVVASVFQRTGSDAPPPVCACEVDVDEIVKKAAILASRGPVLRRDFALRADGGKIVPALTSTPGRTSSKVPSIAPEAAIEEDLRIGHCWTTAVSGQIGISSPTLIHPTHFTVDHVPKELAADIGRAPRHVIVWGLVDGSSNSRRLRALPPDEIKAIADGRTAPPLHGSQEFVPLAKFEYDINAESHIQTFPVLDQLAKYQMDFGVFVVEILDNWGGANTCLYRVRVHGTPLYTVI